MSRARILQLLVLAAFILLSGYLVVLRQRAVALGSRAAALESSLDSLSRICAPTPQPPLPGVSEYDMRQLRNRGAQDLRAQLFFDLRRRTDLIPYEGVLGGTMHFPSPDYFWILAHPWALAYFEDGHRAGYLLLEYRFVSPEEITWKVMGSQLQ